MKPIKTLGKGAFGSDSESGEDEGRKDEKSYIQRAQKRAFGKLKLSEETNKQIYDYDSFVDRSKRRREDIQGSAAKGHKFLSGMRRARKRKELEKLQRLRERNELRDKASEARANVSDKMVFESVSYKKMKKEINLSTQKAVEESKMADESSNRTFESRLLDMYAGDGPEEASVGSKEEGNGIEHKSEKAGVKFRLKKVPRKQKTGVKLKGGLNIRQDTDSHEGQQQRAKIARMMKSKVTEGELEAYRRRYYERREKRRSEMV